MTAAGARARVRAELTREITEVARRHLASEGAAALSLRAVARELGMASSAVYRYFPSRDDLLTALIVDAYSALGEAAERAEAEARGSDGAGTDGAGTDGAGSIAHGPGAAGAVELRARWQAVCRAVREWALAHPHEYALVYGTPVPGYLAPASTVGPAGRVGGLLARIVADGVAVGLVDPTPGPAGADSTLVPGLAERVGLPAEAGNSLLCARAIMAWTTLFGLINFELFGHTHNVVLHHERYFDGAVDDLATLVGLPLPRRRPPDPSCPVIRPAR